MDQQHISINELARELGRNPETFKKAIKRHKRYHDKTYRVRYDKYKCDVLCVSPETAHEIRVNHQTFQQALMQPRPEKRAKDFADPRGIGAFYIVQVCPDLNPLRVKLGFTKDLEDRVATFKTFSPTATLVDSFACRRNWEECAISGLTRAGCRHVGGEVYDCDSLEALQARAREFFGQLPQHNTSTSPLD